MVAGCSSDVLGLRRSVRVAVSWSGQELRAFHEVLDGLGELDYPVEVVPLGDDISTAFGAALHPSAGHRDAAAARTGPPRTSATSSPSRTTWLIVAEPICGPSSWYTTERRTGCRSRRRTSLRSGTGPRCSGEVGVQPPQLWSDWLTLNRSLSLAGIRPLSLAAGDGWVLTDFFENVLLGIAPAVYSALATADSPHPSRQPQFAAALRLLGTMWSAPGALAGGVERSLVQQFPDAIVEVFGHRRAAMVLASDFAEPVVRSFAADPDDVGHLHLPATRAGCGSACRGGR